MKNQLENEKVLLEIKPKKGLKLYWVLCDVAVWSFLGILISIAFSVLGLMILATIRGEKIENIFIGSGIYAPLLIYLFILIITPIVSWYTASMRYRKLQYTLTNKRLIIHRGFVGYSTKSILLERIGEIVVKQTYVQRLCGIQYLLLEVLGTGARTEVLPGVPHAFEVKQQLLELLSKKRRDEKLTY